MLRLVGSYVRRHHVGLMALFIALGGSAYAATLPRNSVGTPQLKQNAVTSSKVLDGSLVASDFKHGQLPVGAAGPQGARGDAGPQGETGPEGPPGADGDSYIYIPDTVVRSTMVNSDLNEETSTVVGCKDNEVPISGGYAGGVEGLKILDNAPATGAYDRMVGWWVRAKNEYGNSYNFTVYVVCGY